MVWEEIDKIHFYRDNLRMGLPLSLYIFGYWWIVVRVLEIVQKAINACLFQSLK